MTNAHSIQSYELKFDCPEELTAELNAQFSEWENVDAVMTHFKDDANGDTHAYAISLFTPQADIREGVTDFLALNGLTPSPIAPDAFTLRPITEADWAEAWKAHWDVDTIIPERLTICPSWKTYTPAHTDEVVLTLDPGSAFGTGTHETTRLMLHRLDALDKAGMLAGAQVLDVGCGSGILSLYAARRHAASVLGLDIDTRAVEVSQENATLNGLDERCRFSRTPLPEMVDNGELAQQVDVLLANILGPVILELLPAMQRALKPGGVLVCSGLIEKSADEVQAALEAAGFQRVTRHPLNHWFALEASFPH